MDRGPRCGRAARILETGDAQLAHVLTTIARASPCRRTALHGPGAVAQACTAWRSAQAPGPRLTETWRRRDLAQGVAASLRDRSRSTTPDELQNRRPPIRVYTRPDKRDTERRPLAEHSLSCGRDGLLDLGRGYSPALFRTFRIVSDQAPLFKKRT